MLSDTGGQLFARVQLPAVLSTDLRETRYPVHPLTGILKQPVPICQSVGSLVRKEVRTQTLTRVEVIRDVYQDRVAFVRFDEGSFESASTGRISRRGSSAG